MFRENIICYSNKLLFMSKREELSECGLLLYLHSQWYVNEVTEMGWYIFASEEIYMHKNEKGYGK